MATIWHCDYFLNFDVGNVWCQMRYFGPAIICHISNIISLISEIDL